MTQNNDSAAGPGQDESGGKPAASGRAGKSRSGASAKSTPAARAAQRPPAAKAQPARKKTIEELRAAQAAANAGQQKVWGDFVTAQEGLVQQDREAQLGVDLANSSAASIQRLIKDNLTKAQTDAIDNAVGALGRAIAAVETKQTAIVVEKKAIDDAAAELKRLLGTIDESKKKLKIALDRVTRLQTDALAAAKGTAPDAARKAYAMVQELKAAQMELAALTDNVDKARLKDEIQAQLTAQEAAQAKLASLTAELKAKEDERRLAEDGRKATVQ